jgi:hypothetical protein
VFYYARAQKQVRPKEGQVAGKKLLMNREPLGFSVLLAIEKRAIKMSATLKILVAGEGFEPSTFGL